MHTRRNVLVSSLAFASVLCLGLAANAALTAQGTSSVRFKAVGPAGMSIDGTTADLSTQDDGTTLTIIVPLKNLTTNMGLRDKHMKETYLQVDKFPDARVAIDRSKLSLPADGASGGGTVPGKLTMHGVTGDVSVKYDAKNAGGTYSVTGSFTVDMTKYGIEVPSYLGVTVKPNVDVAASFQAVDR